MMEKTRCALKLELCCFSYVLAESFHLGYKDIVSILGAKYRRMDWACGSIRLACVFTSGALLHVGFIYCLRKRSFLGYPAPQASFPCCGEGPGSCPGTLQAPQDAGGGRWANRPLRRHGTTAPQMPWPHRPHGTTDPSAPELCGCRRPVHTNSTWSTA